MKESLVMRGVLAVTLLAGLLAGAPLIHAAPPDAPRVPQSTDDEESELRKSIADLSSPMLPVRSLAERRLMQGPTSALKLLPTSEMLRTPAAREAVHRIRLHLSRRRAIESGRASMVDFGEGKPLTASTLQRTIRSQTGNDVSFTVPNPSATFIVPSEKLDFWPAILHIGRENHLRIRSSPPGGIMAMTEATTGASSDNFAPAGPFLLQTSATTFRPLEGRTTGEQLARIPLRVFAEPRLRPLFFQIGMKDLTVRDATGRTLPAWNPEARYELPFNESDGSAFLTIDAVAPPKTPDGKLVEVASITGQANVYMALDAETFKFDGDQLAPGVIRQIGGATVQLKSIHRLNPGEVQIALVASYEAGGPAFESHRSWIFHRGAWCQVGDGPRLPFRTFTTTLEENGATGVEYTFSDLRPGPLRFIYEAPTVFTDLPLEIQIDIPHDKPTAP